MKGFSTCLLIQRYAAFATVADINVLYSSAEGVAYFGVMT
jgi:hypothetical protein